MSCVDLVTGATGFVGRHLARRLLERGRRVRALCRPGSEAKLGGLDVEVARGDLGDRDSLDRATRGVARVYHCAAEVADWGADELFRATNVRGTRWLLEAAASARAERFVHMSSFVVFGVPSPSLVDDDAPYGVSADRYAATKTLGERAVFDFGAAAGLPVTVLRPTVVYGQGSTWMEEPIRMMQRGAFFLLGGGRGTCHPCYVENLADAALLAAEHPRAIGQGFLVSDDDPLPFRGYFAALASLADLPPPSRSIPVAVARTAAMGMETVARVTRARRRPLLTQTAIDLVTTECRVSIRKIRKELGFSPRCSFAEAIDELRIARALASGSRGTATGAAAHHPNSAEKTGA